MDKVGNSIEPIDDFLYAAHIKDDRLQTLINHLLGTAMLSSRFAKKFGKEDWGYCCGLLHDIGKYSIEFQKRIRGIPLKVDHSTAGMKLCLEEGGLYSLLAYCIAGHHSGLPDYGSSSDGESEPTIVGRSKKKICNYEKYKEEIRLPELNTIPVDVKNTNSIEYSLSVFIKMLYSCLVDADYLDTESFMNNEIVNRYPGEPMERLLEKLNNYIKAWLNNNDINTVNGRRSEILKNCLCNGIMKKGMFKLTVPTGGGKTISSLAFALRHAVENNMDRVIYVIPYTSIIEQNAMIFKKILGDKNVLESHCNIEYDEDGNVDLKLATENWDKPVIVTTNVQFFESLYANKSSKCRKLHNIVNSVIIFDEVQMLPIDYLRPCLEIMEELVKNYKTSIVLCSATQPTLDKFFTRTKEITELCPRKEEQFKFFKRTTMKNIGKISEDKLASRLNKETQALCIVNTKKKAQEIFNKLSGNGVYHLSTTMCPIHRKEKLNEIRERLMENNRCIVISTSLVEAGVDLDFKTVYRQLAGIDSIIQAGGRCNREGKNNADQSIVNVFEFDEKKSVKNQRQQIDITRMLLADGYDISSNETIDAYFDNLFKLKESEFDKHEIMKSLSKRAFEFNTVGKKFKLIEENTKTIFVKYNKDAEELLLKIKNVGVSKTLMRKANQYSINVYENDFEKLLNMGVVRNIIEGLEDFYELTDTSFYTNNIGLKIDNDYKNKAIFM